MLSTSIRESAVPTGVFLPVSSSRDEKLARLRAGIHLYSPNARDLAAALVHCAIARTGKSRSAADSGNHRQ
jgi:hypothetical protein